MPYSSVSIANFEQVIAGWEVIYIMLGWYLEFYLIRFFYLFNILTIDNPKCKKKETVERTFDENFTWVKLCFSNMHK